MPKSQQGFTPITIILTVLFLSAGIVGGSFYMKSSNIAPASKPTKENTQIGNVNLESNKVNLIPKLAFAEDSLEGSGYKPRVYVINLDGSDKKEIADLYKDYGISRTSSIVYSPLTNELLLGVSKNVVDASLIGVNLDTLKIRILYDKEAQGLKISPDKKTVIIRPESDKIGVDLNNSSVFPYESKALLEQPYRENESNKSIQIKLVSKEKGASGSYIGSYDIEVINDKSATKKSVRVDDVRKINPLLIKDDYFYFIAVKEYATEKALENLKQLNLSNGEISKPESLALINEKIKLRDANPNQMFIALAGISPDFEHLIYRFAETDISSSQIIKNSRIYDYNLTTNQEKLIKEGGISEPTLTWSSDAGWMFFAENIQNPSNFYLYNTITGSLNKYELPFKGYVITQ